MGNWDDVLPMQFRLLILWFLRVFDGKVLSSNFIKCNCLSFECFHWLGTESSTPKILMNDLVGDAQEPPMTWQWWNSWIEDSVGSKEINAGIFETISKVTSKLDPGSANSLIFDRCLFEVSKSLLVSRKFFHDALNKDMVRILISLVILISTINHWWRWQLLGTLKSDLIS